ncbi:alpha/beta hydrolase family protein [Nonomuraea typhae]|uniref:Alpha/beta hydrolase family protein n=1 Tax=Nonomuraea typhae TaxID=2603600 RepID=A0ABW7Z9M9_9ACTN
MRKALPATALCLAAITLPAVPAQAETTLPAVPAQAETALPAAAAQAGTTLPAMAAQAGTARAARADAQTLTLPAPTGPYPVGTVSLHLVDRSRPDPWVDGRPYRELMVSLWYPAKKARGRLAPHMSPGAAADFGKTLAPAMFGTEPGAVDWAATRTHARQDAPMRGNPPVVVFSPGLSAPRSVGTVLVEDLASRGYLVVTVDHTYEAAQVEFPGGRVERTRLAEPTPEDLAKAVKVRVADTRFVLDQLARRGTDLSRVGMFGHSMGGSAAAEVVHDDRRVDAGLNLDGGHRGPVAGTGVAKPFAQVANETHTRAGDPSWKSFWERSTGWKRELRFTGSQHYSFSDAQTLGPQIDGIPEQRLRALVGAIDPAESIAAQRAYVAAFFDRWLKGRPTTLFDRPSSRHPAVKIIP